jgi:hypothetical protein
LGVILTLAIVIVAADERSVALNHPAYRISDDPDDENFPYIKDFHGKGCI